MGVSLLHLAPHRVNLAVYWGRPSEAEILSAYDALDVSDPASSAPWITWFAPGSDFSDVGLTTFAELKRRLRPKVKAMAMNPAFRAVMVSESASAEAVADFWQAYTGKDRSYPSCPVVFPTLKRACEWLGVPPEGYAAVRDAVRQAQWGRTDDPSAARRDAPAPPP